MRFFLALILLGCADAAFAEAKATLDRTTITTLDNLTLTLEIDQRVDDRPDFSPLHQDFRILGSKRTLISSHSSEGRADRTRWRITLRPRGAGRVQVPPLQLADEQTNPISLEINEVSTSTASGNGSALFFDSYLNSTDVYAGAQLLYTARLYHRDPLPAQSRIDPPAASNAEIRELGTPRQFQGEFRGEPYLITEQQFALFPLQTGSLLIEGPLLELPADGNLVQLQGETLEVEVLAPAHQSSRGIWLPAERVTLADNWNPPEQIHPGDRFTRELTLTVTGIPAERLPALTTTLSDDSFIEVQNVSLSESVTQFGLVSTRRETVAIEPLGAGSFTLDPIDVHWWDVSADRGRHASLPARQYHVIEPPLIETARPFIDTEAKTDTTQSDAPSSNGALQVIIALLALCSLVSSMGWLYTWRRLHTFKAANSAEQREEEIRRQRKLLQANDRAERNTFQALAIACQQNSAVLARTRLIEWAQNFWPEHSVDSLESICDVARNQTLDFLLIDLEQQIRDGAELWQGDLLLETLDSVRRRRQSLISSSAEEPLRHAS